MNALTYTNYKEFLRDYLSAHPGRGAISRVASLCGCDRTYVSQVLNGKADLTPDHMIQFCESAGLSDDESEYLVQLLLLNRSGSLKAKRILKRRIEKLKKEAAVLSNKIKKNKELEGISEAQRSLYYSHWLYLAAHILTSVPEYQTPHPLSEKLNLPVARVTEVLTKLSEMKLVRQEGQRFIHSGGDIYLTKDDPHIYPHHLQWRMKATERAYNGDDIHYTNVFSISVNDVEELRTQVVELIEKQRKNVQNSGTEVVYGFCCDFFEV